MKPGGKTNARRKPALLPLTANARRTNPNANRSARLSESLVGSRISTTSPRTAAAESGNDFTNASTRRVISCSDSLPVSAPASTTTCSHSSDPSATFWIDCSSDKPAVVSPLAKSKDTGGRTINLPGTSHCSAAFNPTAKLWSVGIEIATRGKPAFAVSGKSRKADSSSIGATVLLLANRQSSLGNDSDRNSVAEQNVDFIKIRSDNLIEALIPESTFAPIGRQYFCRHPSPFPQQNDSGDQQQATGQCQRHSQRSHQTHFHERRETRSHQRPEPNDRSQIRLNQRRSRGLCDHENFVALVLLISAHQMDAIVDANADDEWNRCNRHETEAVPHQQQQAESRNNTEYDRDQHDE